MALEQLATSLELSHALVHWLDATSLTPEDMPPELMERLTQQLNVSRDEMETALREQHPEAREYLKSTGHEHLLNHYSFHEALRHDTATAPEQRQHWLDVLDASDDAGDIR
ncbi:MAG: hypothetical protein ABI274_06350 [Ktedonobacterales bacterium]